VLDLDCGSEFDPARDEGFFAALPSRPAVYLIEMEASGAQPYLSRTVDLRRAAERLLRRPEALSKRLNLREVAASIRFRLTGSRFEQSLVLYQQARIHFPKRYRDFLRLRPPAVVKINLRNAYPRCYVTRRISPDEGLYVGPFASRRAAEFFADGFRDLFKVRRCQIKIRRDPEFPGCIYSEMKMCLAPCFAGCTDAEYAAEVARSTEALATLGASLETSLQQEREAASESLDFERAATLHKKLEKVSDVMRSSPGLARRVDQLDAVILQRMAEENTVAFFAVHHGIIADPFLVRFDELSSQPRSVEAIIRGHLEASATVADAADSQAAASSEASDSQTVESATPGAPDLKVQFGIRAVPEELPEHLSLLARWFYAKPREGEIFFRDPTWPYRRLLRACARTLTPPTAPPRPTTSS
jgi:excinuclease UvrABC nuclease subunit